MPGAGCQVVLRAAPHKSRKQCIDYNYIIYHSMQAGGGGGGGGGGGLKDLLHWFCKCSVILLSIPGPLFQSDVTAIAKDALPCTEMIQSA